MDNIDKIYNLQYSIDTIYEQISDFIVSIEDLTPNDSESISYLNNVLDSFTTMSQNIESQSYEELVSEIEPIAESIHSWQGTPYSKLENVYFTTESAKIACINASNGEWNDIYVNSGYNSLQFLTPNNDDSLYFDSLLTNKIENGFVSQYGIYREIINGNLTDDIGSCTIIDFN